jgi:hypothetical protein
MSANGDVCLAKRGEHPYWGVQEVRGESTRPGSKAGVQGISCGLFSVRQLIMAASDKSIS